MRHIAITPPIFLDSRDRAEGQTVRSKDVAAQGRVAETERLLRRRVAFRPASAPAYVDLAAFLCERGRAADALVLLDEVLTARPGSAWALSLKAAVLETERRVPEALAVHERLVAEAPNAPIPWLNYGHALSASGRGEEGVTAYRRALALDPASGFAWWGLASQRTVKLSVEDVDAMERVLPRAAGGLARAQLHFALGKALGDIGRFEASFHHYKQANDLRGELAPYDAGVTANLVQRAKTTFTPEILKRRAGCEARGPIFIVGMPRSGSTLVEQILSSHPLVEGLGELTELDKIAGSIGTEAGQDWTDVVAGFDAAESKALGERYLAGAGRVRRTDRPFFTDKMPANWRYLGLIRLILPNAKIVDVRRDPMACCFSAFTTYFNRATRFPTALEDLGCFYRSYADLVDHLAAMSPGSVYQLRYEGLVENLETEVRRLLAYLELPFDAACLRFYENPRPVHTPSAGQVREPINREGIDRWRSYEAWLAPLRRGLEGRPRSGIAPSNHFLCLDRAAHAAVPGEAALCLGDVS